MMNFFRYVAWNMRLSYRQNTEGVMAVLFFILVCLLFPLGMKPDKNILMTIAPTVVWAAALLASLVSADQMFEADVADGMLDQTLMSSLSPSAAGLGKALSHWLSGPLLVMIAAPVMMILYHGTFDSAARMVVALAVGTPAFSCVCAVSAAVRIGARRNFVLSGLLSIPFMIPVLIFGSLAASTTPLLSSHLWLLGSVSAFSLTLCPWIVGAAIKILYVDTGAFRSLGEESPKE